MTSPEIPEPSRLPRWRRWLFWLIVLANAAVLVVIGALLLGERSRFTLILLYLPRLPLLLLPLMGALVAPLARRRVRWLVGGQLAFGVAIAFAVMGFHIGFSRTAPRPIRLASYNVFFGKLGRPALVEEIASFDADILVLQAAFGSLGETLRARLPDRTIRQEGELVLVSRFPVRAVEVPPPLPDGTPSMFVKYVVDTPEGTLRLFNVHAFSPRHALFGEHEPGDDIAQRDGQIGAAVTAARSDVPPFLLVGDTNLPSLSAIARRHFASLTDAFSEVGLGFGYSFPAKHPWMRIDRALGSDGIRFVDVRVAPQGASDHRALLVDFTMVSGGEAAPP